MASVNKVILVGNLGQDPEVRTFPNGGRVANVTIATTDRWKDKQTNEQREATEWHRVVFNERLADIVDQYLRKGSQVYVEGSLRTRKYTDKDGIERYITEIRADRMQMLGSRQGMGSPEEEDGYGSPAGQSYQRPAAAPRSVPSRPAAPPPQAAPASNAPVTAPQPASNFDDMDDDIPF